MLAKLKRRLHATTCKLLVTFKSWGVRSTFGRWRRQRMVKEYSDRELMWGVALWLADCLHSQHKRKRSGAYLSSGWMQIVPPKTGNLLVQLPEQTQMQMFAGGRRREEDVGGRRVTGIFRLNNLLRVTLMGANGVVTALSRSGGVTFPTHLTTYGFFKVTGVTEDIKQGRGGQLPATPPVRLVPQCVSR